MYKLIPCSPPLFFFFVARKKGNEAINEPQLPEQKEAGLDVIQLTQCEGWILAMHFTRFQLVYHNISAAVLVSLGNSIEQKKAESLDRDSPPFLLELPLLFSSLVLK